MASWSLSTLATGFVNAVSNLGQLTFPAQSLAETTPELTNGWFWGGSGIDLVDRHATYGSLYRAQPAVTAVVNKRADLLASLPVRVMDTSPVVGDRQDKDTALTRLLADPSAGEVPAFAFWRWVSATRDIYGEVFLLKVRDENRQVVALKPMTPARVVAKRDQQGHIFYSFTLGVGSAGILDAPAEDVVAWFNYNPDSIMRGMSMLEPLRATLASEDAARRSSIAFWHNGARPGTVIRHKTTLSPQAMVKIRDQFDQLHAGPEGTGSTAVLDEDMDIKSIQLTQEEAQYVQTRKLNLEEVCMAYDMPPAAIHALLEKASFTSSVEQFRSLGRDTMPPIIESLSSVLDQQLVKDFHPDGSRHIAFGLDEMLRGDFEKLAEAIPRLIGTGAITPNEGRAYMGQPRLDDPLADKLFANQAMQLLGTPVAGPSITEQGPPVADDVVPGGPDQQSADVPPPTKSMSRRVGGMSGVILASSTGLTVKDAKAAMRAKAVEAQKKAIGAGLGRQADAIQGAAEAHGTVDPDMVAEDLAAALYDPADWNEDLAGELEDASTATVDAFGKKVGGKSFDVGKAAAWIAAGSTAAARSMNAATLSRLVDTATGVLKSDDPTLSLVDGVGKLVDYMTGARVDEAAETRTGTLASFGEHEGAVQSGASTKTWVTGSNPRAEHAAMDGEEVGLDEPFSNGGRYPGDPALDVSEVAGCNCALTFSWEK